MGNMEILEMTAGLLEEADSVVQGNQLLVDTVLDGRDYGELTEPEAARVLPLLMSNRMIKKLTVSVRYMTEHLMELYDLADKPPKGD